MSLDTPLDPLEGLGDEDGGQMQGSVRDFVFIKWFMAISTSAVLALSAYLFNLSIKNQSTIKEVLIEIRTLKEDGLDVSQEIKILNRRFDDLSKDPVHGWASRWTRTEAERENARQDKSLALQAEALSGLAGNVQDVNLRLSAYTTELDTTLKAVQVTLKRHEELDAHLTAERRIGRAEDRLGVLEKSRDEQVSGHLAHNMSMLQDRLDRLVALLSEHMGIQEEHDGSLLHMEK